MRCAKCQAVFRVRPPAEPPLEAMAAMPLEPEPMAPPRLAPAPEPAAAPRAQAPDRERLVVIADPEVEAGKRTASAIAAWGLQPILVHDGVEAMLTIQRALPRAVVLDAALPKMYGFQICEVLKRNESLRTIRVALVGAIHHQGRYRRPPSDLYGADVYVERPDLPDALAAVLRGWGMPLREEAAERPARAPARPRSAPPPEPPAREERGSPAPRPAPAATPAAPAALSSPASAAPARADDGLAEERAKAARLARIVVSDIVLYNPEKFEAGVRSGDVVRALEAELAEGRALFATRIDARVRGERDHLADELVRVARERGAR
jgi:CheY-like chemotaxis protein